MGFDKLVPRASFPLTSGRKTRALGATISGMRHRCRCAVSRITRIRLFPLFFHNGCSQSSRFPTAGQGERSSGNEIGVLSAVKTSLGYLCFIFYQKWTRLLHERTVSSSDTIWSLATIREVTMYVYIFDFEVRVASRARQTASHERLFVGPFG